MKSNKQRKAELRAKKQAKVAKAKREVTEQRRQLIEGLQKPLRGCVAANPANLAPNNCFGALDFVAKGYYEDLDFQCEACGSEEVWLATQQKWWYEVAKGSVYSTAKLCRVCRRKKREGRLK